jgi:hypothetical protein
MPGFRARLRNYVFCIMCFERMYCVLHALRRHQGTMSDDGGSYKFTVCIAFSTHTGSILKVISVREAYVRLTWGHFWGLVAQWRFWSKLMLGASLQSIAKTKVFAIRDVWGCYKLNVSIGFYMHWGDIRVPWLMARDATNSTYALCFTCIEVTSGYHDWCRGML